MVGDAEDVLEEGPERVPKAKGVCVTIIDLVIWPLGVGTPVFVFIGENDTVELLNVVAEDNIVNVGELVVEKVDLRLAPTVRVTVLEVLGDPDPVAHIVDVLEGACDFVKLVFELGVLDGLELLELVNVCMIAVTDRRGLELLVFEVLMLAVVVVDCDGVFVDKGHLDAVVEAVVVLEVIDVPVLVRELWGVVVPFELTEPLGEPVDVLEGAMDLV